jgi:hypothetical protein
VETDQELIAKLTRLVHREALQIAERVRAGQLTRTQIEEALAETGDGEPAIALEWLDEWGIR